MTLSQDQLKAFFEISKSKSFTKAASSLGLTQSALSHRIKNLESDLETSLFVRATAGIRLTDAGAKLLKYVQVQTQIETEFLSDLTKGVTTEMSGTLRIAGASTLMWSVVAPALTPFLKKNSNVHFEMMVREISELPEMLKSGEIDMIVTCGKPDLHQYEEIFLGYELNVLVESSKQTSREIYLDHNPKDQTTIRYLELMGKSSQKMKRAFMEDIHGILTGVEAGLGKAVVPLHLLKERKNLQAVKGANKQKSPVYLCFLKQPFYTRLQTSVTEILKEKSESYLKP